MRELTYFPLLQSYPKTSGYGSRTDPITGAPGKFHKGVDYGAPYGAPVVAPYDGQVTTGYESGGAGNWSWVVAGPDMFKSFHHDSVQVSNGWVPAGTVIAYIGSTGSSTGSHAHLELWESGINIDPTGFLDRAPLRDSPPIPPEDEMTDEDFNRIASMFGVILDNRIDQFMTANLLWQDGDHFYEVLVRDGCRVRRELQPGELLVLRGGSIMAEQPMVNVDAMDQAQRDAFRNWEVV